jgi:hypothetical protein
MSQVLATFRIDARYTPGFMKPAFRFRAKPGAHALRVRGSQAAAVQRALMLSRREDRAWGVIQASAGVYLLQPLWINRSSDDPSIEGLKELTEVPGRQRLWLERTDPSLVAVTDASAYVFGQRSRLLVAQG